MVVGGKSTYARAGAMRHVTERLSQIPRNWEVEMTRAVEGRQSATAVCGAVKYGMTVWHSRAMSLDRCYREASVRE